MKRCNYYAALMAVLCLFTGWLCAQNVTGAVSGVVTDPSGAVIPGATVVVHNVGTGVNTTVTTNEVGLYSARFLSIGQYQITVSANGFATSKFTPFTLEINQTAKFDAKLQPGGASTVTDVSAEAAPILNTNDSSLGISLSTNEIANIPLNGRNFSSVTLFQPGAIATDPQGMTGNNAIERSTFNNGVASINGNRNQANYYTLDGADLNEPQNNLIAYNPAPDAIAEVRVISANAPAQFGNANGGAVISVLKSGTNQFHGSAYAFLQNQNLNANSWANKHANPIIAINPYTQTIFGGTVGGPVLKDKLFFFADYEGARSHTGGLQQASVVPAAMRNGDFSSLLRTDTPIQLYDTQNGFAAYANNQLPILNPVAKYLFAHPEFYPTENATPTDGLLQNNFQGAQRKFVRNDQGDIKIEWNASGANKFTAFYSQSDAGDTQTALIPITFPPQNVYPTKLGGGSWIHTFSPAIVNEARFGFTRVRWDNSIPTDPSGAFGLNGNSVVGVPFGAQPYPGFSGQSLGNNASFLGTNANIQVLRDNTFNYYDNLTWQRGRHLLSIGIQATRYQQNYLNSSNYGFLGEFDYSGNFTGLPGGAGYGPADFVLDRVSSSQLGSSIGFVGNRQWRTAGYIQDDWKALDNLTINIGLRYEFDQPWGEVNNKTANVDLATGIVQFAHSIPAGAPAGSQLCSNRACYNPNYAQWMPRIGFALQVNPRLVVRGGYGATSFFEGNAGNQRLTSSPPFAQGSHIVAINPSDSNAGTPFRIEDGFSSSFSATSQYSVWPKDIRPAYIQQFSLTTEFALTNMTSLTVGYLGETGQHLIDYRNGNQLTAAQAAIYSALPEGAPVPPAAQAPYANLVGQTGPLLVTESNAMMNYNGGQVTVRHRADRGFEYTVNYTYAKSMTNSAGNYGQPGIGGSTGAFQDAYNPQADYAPSGQDVRHNLNAVGVYALPFGRNQFYGSHTNRALDLIAGGWKVSSTVIAYTGLPITIQAPNVSNSFNSFSTSRANHYRKLVIRNRSIDNWWGTDPSAIPCNGPDNGVCAYGVAAPNTFGTARPSAERVPGFAQIDGAAFKDFHITEGHVLGFRAEGFNLFNIASYQNPDASVQDSNFGQITNTRSKERVIQLNLHYSF